MDSTRPVTNISLASSGYNMFLLSPIYLVPFLLFYLVISLFISFSYFFSASLLSALPTIFYVSHCSRLPHVCRFTMNSIHLSNKACFLKSVKWYNERYRQKMKVDRAIQRLPNSLGSRNVGARVRGYFSMPQIF